MKTKIKGVRLFTLDEITQWVAFTGAFIACLWNVVYTCYVTNMVPSHGQAFMDYTQ